MKSTGHVSLLLTASVAAIFAYACGASTGPKAGEGEAAGADGGGSDGGDGLTLGGGSGGASTGGVAPGSLAPNATCGGKPCANYTGTKEFSVAGAPASAAALFNGGSLQAPGTNPAQEPVMVYPSHETMFPVNVSHIHHEWRAGGSNDLFRLTFAGPKTTVVVYTNATSWEPSEEEWDWLAESNRGGAVTLTVAALVTSSPGTIWQSKPQRIHFSDSEVEGAIYYWSTGTSGIMKALVSDPLPVKFYTDPQASDSGTCVACHTLSRDGKRMAMGYGGEKLREISVPDRTKLVPAAGQGDRASGWTTFSPDGKKLLVASGGVLTLLDADTGVPIGANNGVVPLPAGKYGTHPDWSALGDKVVFTLATKAGNKDVQGGSIAILPYKDGAWGTAQVLVASTSSTDNNFFPSFSPDSKWIAYVHANGASKDAVSATLRLVSSAGGAPVSLVRLNERVNNADGVTNLGNSMPTWAPSTKPGLFWLAFSSLRAYGTLRPLDSKKDQIWIGAIDPAQPDPGYTGFWAPFQSIPDGNHRAFWTHDASDKQCRCVDICGDGLDNNCNGTADEAGCSTCLAQEICGDGIDNNCNCVVDECVSEICDDGVDNDGDGLADGADPQCQVVK